jgi:16S rRNA (guanine527-N7)-methyltransferase
VSALSPDIQAKLKVYQDLLLKWQKSVNLVAPSTLAEAWARHFEDSLQLCDLIPQNAVIADIGSGAGFPGLVIAIARPDLKVHLIESDSKKCAFLLAVSRETGAKTVDIHQQRIEDVLPGLKVDFITARALAPLTDLLRLCASQPHATKLFLKGEAWPKEVEMARADHVFDVVPKPSKTEPSAAILCIAGA